MPVRSRSRSSGPQSSVSVKHCQPAVYMNCVLHSTNTVRSATESTSRARTTSIPPDQRRRGERDEDAGAHETRAVPPTRQIPTTPVHPNQSNGGR